MHLEATYEMSERRACQVIQADRKTIRYKARRPSDADLRLRLRELAAEQRRLGYRRLHVLLRGEGHVVNRKKTQRLYREEGRCDEKRAQVPEFQGCPPGDKFSELTSSSLAFLRRPCRRRSHEEDDRDQPP